MSGPLPIFRRRAVAVPKAAVGNTLGWAALAAVITAAAAGSTPEGAATLLGGLHWGLWSAIAFAVLALMLVVVSCALKPPSIRNLTARHRGTNAA